MSQQINLFNPIFLKQKKVFGAVPMLQALGVILAGTVALSAFASYRVNQLDLQAAAGKTVLAGREARLTKAIAQFAPRPKSVALAAEIAEAEAKLQSLREVEGVLRSGALGNTSGYAEYFRAFSRQNVRGLWLTGLSIDGAGNDIGVQGKAMQPTLIPAFIARLTTEKVMHGRSFASLQIARPEMVQVLRPAEVPPPPRLEPSEAEMQRITGKERQTGAPRKAAPNGPSNGSAAGGTTGRAAPALPAAAAGSVAVPAAAQPAVSGPAPYVEFNLQSTAPEGGK